MTQSDVLDIDPQDSAATTLADLTQAETFPSNTFDCVVLTQVLQFVYDAHAALRTVHRIVKPDGVLLLTVPGITQITYKSLGPTWYWSFAPTDTTIKLYGNVLTATALLYGMGQSELTKEEYEHQDPE